MRTISIFVMLVVMCAAHLSRKLFILGKTNSLKKTYLITLCRTLGNQIGFFFELNFKNLTCWIRSMPLWARTKVFMGAFFFLLFTILNCLLTFSSFFLKPSNIN